MFFYLLKNCIRICGFIKGIIISVILLVVIANKFDDFLVTIGLATDDSVYNPFFDAIGLILTLYHAVGAFISLRKFLIWIKAENQLETEIKNQLAE